MARWDDEYGDIIRSAMADLGMQPPERDPNVPPEVIYGDQLKHYPDAADVENARANDFSYGSGNEAFNSGQVARVIDPKLDPELATYGKLTAPESGMSAKGSPALAQNYEAAQLAANRSPIAALGYDPRAFNVDPNVNNDMDVNGVYSRETKRGYSNSGSPSNLVHESVHRGMDRLRDDGLLSPDLKSRLPDDEEYIIRYIMSQVMGDPERSPTGDVSRYRDAALMLFGKDNNDPQTNSPYADPRAPGYRAAVEELNKIAAQHLFKLHPGGPR